MTARDGGWRARSGVVPALASEFTLRPQTAPGVEELLAPGTAVALVPAGAGAEPTGPLRPPACAGAGGGPSEPPASAGLGAGPLRPSGLPGQSAEVCGPSARPGGSCGRTQLAANLAGELWRSGQVEFLAWIDASSRASVLSGYAEAAAAMGIEVNGPAEQVAGRLAGWLADTTRPWMIVLDDLRHTADTGGLWPTGPAGRILITAQDERAVPASPGAGGEPSARLVPVGPFSTREALEYLMASLAADPDQRHGAIDLAIALGGDPVALAQASAVIATTTWSCRDYHQRYAEVSARLLAGHPYGEPPAPLAVTWLLSAERAWQIAPGGATRLLLELAALLDGQVIPAALFISKAVRTYLAGAGAPGSAGHAWQAVEVLEDTGLLTVDQAPASLVVRVSRPVAALVRAAMTDRSLRRAALAAADALLEIWPREEPAPWTAAGLRSCADALAQMAGDRLWNADGCHPLLHVAGHSASAARLTGPAAAHWAQIVTTSERITGPASPHTLTAASDLAGALHAAGNAPHAVTWWQWAADGHARVSGPDHPATLAAHIGLGQALAAAGRPGDAITVLEQAVARHERVGGAGHLDTIRAREQLAAACQAAGRADDAIGHYQRNVASLERTHGARHVATIRAHEQLAAACLAAGRTDEAITAYRTALAARQDIQGEGHLDTITTRRNLAAACQAAGQISAALRLHDQARASYQQILGSDHPGTLACQADLATAYHAAGRLADATTLLRHTLTRCHQALPPAHPLTTTIQHALTTIASP